MMKWINIKNSSDKKFIAPICKYLGKIILEGVLYECIKCGAEKICEAIGEVIDENEDDGPSNNTGGCDHNLGCNPPERQISFSK